MRPKSRAISAAEANRRFSEVLRSVRAGDSIVVTSHGKPVAKIMPVDEVGKEAHKAQSALFTRLRKQRAVQVGKWTRDELYDSE